MYLSKLPPIFKIHLFISLIFYLFNYHHIATIRVLVLEKKNLDKFVRIDQFCLCLRSFFSCEIEISAEI